VGIHQSRFCQVQERRQSVNEQFIELELNTKLLYLSLLRQRMEALQALIAMETRIEVFESAFNIEGDK
jgi:hypothetical protein